MWRWGMSRITLGKRNDGELGSLVFVGRMVRWLCMIGLNVPSVFFEGPKRLYAAHYTLIFLYGEVNGRTEMRLRIWSWWWNRLRRKKSIWIHCHITKIIQSTLLNDIWGEKRLWSRGVNLWERLLVGRERKLRRKWCTIEKTFIYVELWRTGTRRERKSRYFLPWRSQGNW